MSRRRVADFLSALVIAAAGFVTFFWLCGCSLPTTVPDFPDTRSASQPVVFQDGIEKWADGKVREWSLRFDVPTVRVDIRNEPHPSHKDTGCVWGEYDQRLNTMRVWLQDEYGQPIAFRRLCEVVAHEWIHAYLILNEPDFSYPEDHHELFMQIGKKLRLCQTN